MGIKITSRKAKAKYSHLIDPDTQKEIEKRVTKYIQDNFSFVVFNIEEKEKRLITNTALSFVSIGFSLYTIAGFVTASVFIVQNWTNIIKMSQSDYQNIQIVLASSSGASFLFSLLFIMIPLIINHNFRKKVIGNLINKYNERIHSDKKKNDLSIIFDSSGNDKLNMDNINIGLIYRF